MSPQEPGANAAQRLWDWDQRKYIVFGLPSKSHLCTNGNRDLPSIRPSCGEQNVDVVFVGGPLVGEAEVRVASQVDLVGGIPDPQDVVAVPVDALSAVGLFVRLGDEPVVVDGPLVLGVHAGAVAVGLDQGQAVERQVGLVDALGLGQGHQLVGPVGFGA